MMSFPLPLSGVCQSITNHMKYRVERGHSEVNIRYTIKIIHATPEGECERCRVGQCKGPYIEGTRDALN